MDRKVSYHSMERDLCSWFATLSLSLLHVATPIDGMRTLPIKLIGTVFKTVALESKEQKSKF